MAIKREPSSQSDSEEEEEEEEEEELEDVEEQSGSEGDEDSGTTPESVRKLLQPFGRDQLIDLLKEAARSNPEILKRIVSSVESDTTHRKIFIYGLGWDISSEAVKAAFQKYGELEECKVVMDRVTGKSKGYGFVLFKRRADAQKALKEPQKNIGNRIASCQLAAVGVAGGGGGVGREKKAEGGNMVVNTGGIAGTLQPNDLALTYRMGSVLGVNPMDGLMGGIVGQNIPMGMTAMSPSLSRGGTALGGYGPGFGLGIGGAGVPWVNAISPSAIGSYSSQIGMQGSYQSGQVPSTTAGMTRQSGSGNFGAHYSLGR